VRPRAWEIPLQSLPSNGPKIGGEPWPHEISNRIGTRKPRRESTPNFRKGQRATTEQHRIEAEYQRELRLKRAAWEAERKAHKEQEERNRKQAALEAYLHQRAQEWTDTTGTAPADRVMEGWQREYLDARQNEAEADRAARLEAAEAESGF
jgi:hypothetical protein